VRRRDREAEERREEDGERSPKPSESTNAVEPATSSGTSPFPPNCFTRPAEAQIATIAPTNVVTVAQRSARR